MVATFLYTRSMGQPTLMSTKSTSMVRFSSSAHLVMVSGKAPSSYGRCWSKGGERQGPVQTIAAWPHPDPIPRHQPLEMHQAGERIWEVTELGLGPRREDPEPCSKSWQLKAPPPSLPLSLVAAPTWTPKMSSHWWRLSRAHSDVWPCSRLVQTAISPHVTSAP